MPDNEKKMLVREIKEMSRKGRKRARKRGIKESDIPELVHKLGGVKD